ncbi:PREDICTED: dof zinc finger protein DOF1.6 [Tarenaya hassleriana]|uniref:dof zinc finger protein DOF1.6 n=1 Tax=Tarenaya hassleriana TaxID=28532 RepID=UPI00053C364A|nr:PREDICTED: dof zinc finger protein DOF1.6 [Tarenaya hassleriana]
MPSSESGHVIRPGRVQATTAAYPPPKLSEPLPCPRFPGLGPGPGDVAVEAKDGDFVSGYGSFASLLSGQSNDGTFLALGSGTGLGHGFGYGFEEMGIGYPGYFGGGGPTVPATVGSSGGDTWQVGEMEVNGGDSFVWPGLEISMHGNNVK